MPGNVPNVSQDIFDYAAEYDSVRLQQGVPISDSDWNEESDIRLMSGILVGSHVLGDLLLGSGFKPAQAGSTSNNFAITGGWALVKGVLVATSSSETPAAIDYTSESNYLAGGVVSSVGGGILTDSQKNWQAFHALLPSGANGACRVRMLDGAEAGNTFVITAFTATTLTLSGGTAGILAGDTYKVLPPALTTPGGSRTDAVYLMVWWEDIADEETDGLLSTYPIAHPGLAIETSHRSKRRWCVRVNQASTTPVTPAVHAFGVRYLELGTIVRTASVDILTAMLTFSAYHVTYQAHLDSVTAHLATNLVVNASSFLSATLTAVGLGGLGTGSTNIQTALQAANDGLVRRRGFTAVITDGTGSTGGDHNGPTAAQLTNSATYSGGTFMLRRGVLHTIPVSADISYNATVLGERRYRNWSPGEVATQLIALPVGIPSPVSGKWENVRFQVGSTSTSLQTADRDFEFSYGHLPAGVFQVGSQGTTRLRNVAVVDDGVLNSQNNLGGLYLHGPVTIDRPAVVDVDQCRIEGNAATNTPTGALHLAAGGQLLPSPSFFEHGVAVFQATKFVSNAASTSFHSALYGNGAHGRVLFRGCTFQNTDVANDQFLIDLTTCTGLEFENCWFISVTGQILSLVGVGATFKNCWVIGGANTAGVVDPQLVCGYGYSKTHMLAFENCRVKAGAANIQTAAIASQPWFLLGGTGASSASRGAYRIEDTTIEYPDAPTGIHRAASVVFSGGASLSSGPSHIRRVTLDMQNAGWGATATPWTGAIASVVHFEGVSFGQPWGTRGMLVEDFKIIKCVRPTADVANALIITNKAKIDGLGVHATGLGGGDFDYTVSPFSFGESVVKDFNVNVNGGGAFQCTAANLISLVASKLSGDFSQLAQMGANTTVAPSVAYIGLDTNSELVDAFFDAPTGFTGTVVPVARMSSGFCRINKSDLGRPTASTVAVVADNGSSLHSVVDNTITGTDSTTFDVISMTGTGAIVSLNRVRNNGTGAATVSNTGTGAQTGLNYLGV